MGHFYDKEEEEYRERRRYEEEKEREERLYGNMLQAHLSRNNNNIEHEIDVGIDMFEVERSLKRDIGLQVEDIYLDVQREQIREQHREQQYQEAVRDYIERELKEKEKLDRGKKIEDTIKNYEQERSRLEEQGAAREDIEVLNNLMVLQLKLIK